jgi:hypothetical protein
MFIQWILRKQSVTSVNLHFDMSAYSRRMHLSFLLSQMFLWQIQKPKDGTTMIIIYVNCFMYAQHLRSRFTFYIPRASLSLFSERNNRKYERPRSLKHMLS